MSIKARASACVRVRVCMHASDLYCYTSAGPATRTCNDVRMSPCGTACPALVRGRVTGCCPCGRSRPIVPVRDGNLSCSHALVSLRASEPGGSEGHERYEPSKAVTNQSGWLYAKLIRHTPSRSHPSKADQTQVNQEPEGTEASERVQVRFATSRHRPPGVDPSR